VEGVLVAILVASGVIAFGVGRWWTLFVPITAVSVFYAGLNAGWWGNGVGDGWQFAAAFVMGIGVLAGVIGVVARRLVKPRAEQPAAQVPH
jgi:hypothetical protein